MDTIAAISRSGSCAARRPRLPRARDDRGRADAPPPRAAARDARLRLDDELELFDPPPAPACVRDFDFDVAVDDFDAAVDDFDAAVDALGDAADELDDDERLVGDASDAAGSNCGSRSILRDTSLGLSTSKPTRFRFSGDLLLARDKPPASVRYLSSPRTALRLDVRSEFPFLYRAM
jgi:hypothetical protein